MLEKHHSAPRYRLWQQAHGQEATAAMGLWEGGHGSSYYGRWREQDQSYGYGWAESDLLSYSRITKSGSEVARTMEKPAGKSAAADLVRQIRWPGKRRHEPANLAKSVEQWTSDGVSCQVLEGERAVSTSQAGPGLGTIPDMRILYKAGHLTLAFKD